MYGASARPLQTVLRSAARVLPDKRRRRRRSTRLRDSISCNRRRRNASTGPVAAAVVGPPTQAARKPRPPPSPDRHAAITRGRRANGRTGPTTPNRPPPSAIGRPIELFVYPAAFAYRVLYQLYMYIFPLLTRFSALLYISPSTPLLFDSAAAAVRILCKYIRA